MQRLTYIIIILGIITLFTGQSFSQDMKFTLRGMVISEESQKPLIGVTIQDTVSGAGRISDRDGKFQMEIEKLPVVLVFRHLGYFEDTLRIKNKKQYKEYIEGKTIIISLRVNPFLLDEVVVSDSRIAVKLFEKEPYSIIDFVVRDNRFYAFGYKNYNPLRREVFLGDHSGRILDSRSLPGTNEIYMDCQGEIYAVTSDTAYIFSKSSDLIEITPVCRTEFFYQMVKPIKALDEDSFIFLEKSEEGRFHDYSIGNAENNKLEVFYRACPF